MIYFDHAATTAIYPEALVSYQEVATKIMGNPSSLHQLGTQATRILEASRKQIAELLGMTPAELFFTSGGTESDNWAIKGVAFEKSAIGKHILISDIEHPAVSESARWLASEGFEVERIPVDITGRVQQGVLANMICKDTILVSVMAVNNEVGAIQPIAAISQLLEDYPGITFHVDGVQALGHLPLTEFMTPRVDMASFSAHKLHGPRGVGFLYVKKGKRLTPLLHGGGQETAQRATTENVPGIAATAKAMRLSIEGQERAMAHISHLSNALYEGLSHFSHVTLFSRQESCVPNIVTFGIRNLRGEVLVHALEEKDIYISTTSACSSKAGQAPGTLLAMGIPKKEAETAVRISLDASNTMAEVDQFLRQFTAIYQQTESIR